MALDPWAVITAFFDEKGLVRQQLNSFDEFTTNTIARVVRDTQPLVVRPNAAYLREGEPSVLMEVNFGAAKLVEPEHIDLAAAADEGDGENKEPAVHKVYPNECRLRNMTYASRLFVDLTVHQKDSVTGELIGEKPLEFCEKFASIPIMVSSAKCRLGDATSRDKVSQGECHFDMGGYFIVNGTEKVVIAQERIAFNKVYCFKTDHSQKFSWQSEVRSHVLNSNRPISSFNAKMYRGAARATSESAGGEIVTALPRVHAEVPLAVLFRALGLANDKQILSHVVYDLSDAEMVELLRPSLEAARDMHSTDMCRDYIARRAGVEESTQAARVQYALELLQKDLLPHVGVEAEPAVRTRKGFFVGYVVHRLLLCVLGRDQPDDRDHFGNKRLDMAGALLGQIFRSLFYRVTQSMRKHLEKSMRSGRKPNVPMAVDANEITRGISYCLATGNWGLRDADSPPRTGVAQPLNRLTFTATLSHLRRLNAGLGSDGKIPQPRMLHNTQWGMLCPCETPEGGPVGLVKNFSLMAYVSVGTVDEPVRRLLDDYAVQPLEEVSPELLHMSCKVFVNGAWIGATTEPESIVQRVRQVRRDGDLDAEVSIMRDIAAQEVHVWTDPGRVARPLFVVDSVMQHDTGETRQELRYTLEHMDKLVEFQRQADLDDGDEEAAALPEEVHKRFSWLMNQGVVEYVDVAEEEVSMIAMRPEDLNQSYCSTYTHCEIHPAMMLGICASIIPFPDHNQSPRNTYQSAMGKQAMGVYASNYALRLDTTMHVLYYPQKPLVVTRAMQYMHFEELPAGVNVVVAIACFTGYNQEDSLLMNRAAVDRGLFRSVYFRTHTECENKQAQQPQLFECPDYRTTKSTKFGSYDKLDKDGLVQPGTPMGGGDIFVGRTEALPANDMYAMQLRSYSKRDVSAALRNNERGIVDTVALTTDANGNRMVKTRLRNIRIPQIGDKFASRHGQKGTVGMLISQEDMPFTRDGVTPDIIMNPHAVPSRMTIGQLIECVMGKVMTIRGSQGDGTPFSEQLQIRSMSNRLHKYGYQRSGNEVLYSGHTGRKLDAQIFMGPVYYQRLKHMVADKVHARSRGPNALLTRQPMEGRGKEGGLRFGEMERDAIIAHGTASLLQERMMINSDAYRIHVCDSCGCMAKADLQTRVYECLACKSADVSQVAIPYACKLLFQELSAMAIVPRMLVTPRSTGYTERYHDAPAIHQHLLEKMAAGQLHMRPSG